MGLYHVGARAYDPRTDRWLQRDPIDAASGDPNLYRHAGNDPVNCADPSGLEALDDAAHFAAGWGDRLTGNLPKHIRDWLCDLLYQSPSQSLLITRQTLQRLPYPIPTH